MPRSGTAVSRTRSFEGQHTFKLLEEAHKRLLLRFAPALADPGFKEMLPDKPCLPISHNVVGNYLYVLSRFPVDVVEKPLSPRQKQITLLVGEGHPNKTIAAKLELKRSTVASYLRDIFKKLAIGSRVVLGRYLIALIAPLEQLIEDGSSQL